MTQTEILDAYADGRKNGTSTRFNFIRALTRRVKYGHPLLQFNIEVGGVTEENLRLARDCARFS